MTAYVASIWDCRYFWLSLVKNDLQSRYRRSTLGMGWSLLQPLAMTTVLCLVFHKIFNLALADYAPYVLAGLSVWAFIVAVVQTGSHCFIVGEPYIRQHPAPLAIYPLRAVLAAGFHFGIALALVLALSWAFRGFENFPAVFVLVPNVALLLLLGWSLAVLLGFMNTFFPDTAHLADVGLQILFYMTPVMYPPEILESKGLSWIMDYNPAAACLQLVREPILKGAVPSAHMYLLALSTAAVAFSLAIFALVRWRRQLIFHL